MVMIMTMMITVMRQQDSDDDVNERFCYTFPCLLSRHDICQVSLFDVKPLSLFFFFFFFVFFSVLSLMSLRSKHEVSRIQWGDLSCDSHPNTDERSGGGKQSC